VERELTFVACSPKNRVCLYGVDVLYGTILLQRRRTTRIKEGYIGIHPCVSASPSRLFLSFTYIFNCLLLAEWLVTLSKFT
jgi:hypothetical protein